MISTESTLTCISLSLHGTQTALFEAERKTLLSPEERILPIFCPLSLATEEGLPPSEALALLEQYQKHLKSLAKGEFSLTLTPPHKASGWVYREIKGKPLEELFSFGNTLLFDEYPPL
ncbi:MAG: hypothetical protein LBU99_07340, partial [Spirochaetaceae bacterium]|nr:hypothetical protein [Spirochaetaceae bacterium]